MRAKIVNKSKHPLPKYETAGSAGMDIRANIIEEIELKPNEVVIVPTGLFIHLPFGLEAQIRTRSGMAAKHKIVVLNSPGTIDSDYRGEIGVILINHSKNIHVIEDGDRIAQMVIARHLTIEWEEETELEVTQRGEGGFGSTGK